MCREKKSTIILFIIYWKKKILILFFCIKKKVSHHLIRIENGLYVTDNFSWNSYYILPPEKKKCRCLKKEKQNTSSSMDHDHSALTNTATTTAKPRSRIFGRDTNNPDEALILNLKLHLDKLQRERAYKNAALAARNALLIDEAVLAEAEYRRTHKSDEELYEEWKDETRKQHIAERVSFERDEEALIRAMIEEEEALERQVVMHNNNLSLFTFTVERMVSHHKKQERAKMEKDQKNKTLRDAFLRSAKLLFDGWQDGASGIEREEKGSRRNISSRFPADLAFVKKLCDERVRRETEETERERAAGIERRKKMLDDEVDDMEAAYAARMEKLKNKFQN